MLISTQSSTFLETGPKLGINSFYPSISYPVTPTLPFLDILYPVGFNPYRPQKLAGILILPAESEQIPKGEHFAETIPHNPPEEPPTVNN